MNNPMGCRSGSKNGPFTTSTAPNGQSGGPDAGAHTTIGWSTSGQVTSVTDPMGYKTSYDLTGFDPSTGTGFITVTDADGNTTVYDYTLGTLAAESVWNGAVGSTLSGRSPSAPLVTTIKLLAGCQAGSTGFSNSE